VLVNYEARATWRQWPCAREAQVMLTETVHAPRRAGLSRRGWPILSLADSEAQKRRAPDLAYQWTAGRSATDVPGRPSDTNREEAPCR
jgi:hypothetical protein